MKPRIALALLFILLVALCAFGQVGGFQRSLPFMAQRGGGYIPQLILADYMTDYPDGRDSYFDDCAGLTNNYSSVLWTNASGTNYALMLPWTNVYTVHLGQTTEPGFLYLAEYFDEYTAGADYVTNTLYGLTNSYTSALMTNALSGTNFCAAILWGTNFVIHLGQTAEPGLLKYADYLSDYAANDMVHGQTKGTNFYEVTYWTNAYVVKPETAQECDIAWDGFEHYSATNYIIIGLSGGDCWWSQYYAHLGPYGIVAFDNFQTYPDSPSISGLKGGQDWLTTYVGRRGPRGIQCLDTFADYDAGDPVAGLNEGWEWPAAFATYYGPYHVRGYDTMESYSAGALDGLNGGAGVNGEADPGFASPYVAR